MFFLRRILFHVGALGLALTPVLAQATTIARLPVTSMTQLASDVVHGTVSRVESRWTADRSQVLTYVTLSGVERLKGEGPAEVTFIQWGGRIGDEEFAVLGSATFREGEEVVVFLDVMESRAEYGVPSAPWILGLSQGKWDVVTDAATGERLAVNAAARTGRVMGAVSPDAPDRIPLAELVRRVRAAAPENLMQLGGN